MQTALSIIVGVWSIAVKLWQHIYFDFLFDLWLFGKNLYLQKLPTMWQCVDVTVQIIETATMVCMCVSVCVCRCMEAGLVRGYSWLLFLDCPLSC